MAIKIAHASLSEKGGTKNGNAGDQTGKEVCIRTWYSKPWQYVIRFKDASMREKVATAMEHACNNNNIGYDQNQRNTLLTKARGVGYDPSKVTEKCETDCSALVSLACMYAGISESSLVVSGNSATTSTLRSRLVNTGKVEVFKTSKYTGSDNYLLRGDILLKEGSHVVVAIENGSKTNVVNPYSYEQFVKDIQIAIGVPCNGIVNSKMLLNLPTVSKTKNRKHAVVEPLQKYLKFLGFDCGTVDGVAGLKFDKASKAWAKANGCTADGEFTNGGKSWRTILKYSSTTTSSASTTTTSSTSSSKKYMYNGINYSLVFNSTYYANTNPDVVKVYGKTDAKLFEHFTKYGMSEGRRGSANFNVNAYKNRYADLREKFHNNLPMYYEHYIKHGYEERRNAT